MDYFEREERRRRIIGWMMLAGLVLLIIFGCMRNCRRGITAGVDFLYRRTDTLYSDGTSHIALGTIGEQVLCEMSLRGYAQSAVITATGNRRDGNPEYQVELENGSVVTGYLTPSGTFYNHDWQLPVIITVGDDYELRDEWVAGCAVKAAFGDEETNGSGWFVFLGALFYGIGMLMWLFPEQTHELTSFGRRLMYQDASLTADGVVMVQVAGIVVMLLGAALGLRLLPDTW